MRGAGNLAEISQQLHICRLMTEIVVANQAAIGLSAELTELLLVDLLEQWALVPSGVGKLAQMPIKLALGDVHDSDFEHRVGLGLEDQIFESAPGALNLLEFRRMHDFVHLRREFLV